MNSVQYVQPQRQTLYGQWVNPLAERTLRHVYTCYGIGQVRRLAGPVLWGARVAVGLTVVAPVVGTVQKAAWGAADLFKKAQNLLSSPFNYNIQLPDF